MNFPDTIEHCSLHTFELGSYAVNNFLLADYQSGHALLIDAGEEPQKILDFLNENNLTLDLIVNTHGHADHIAGNEFLIAETGAELCIHEEDAPALTDPARNLSIYVGNAIISPPAQLLIKHEEMITWGNLSFTVLHCPGHSPGGMALYGHNLLFAGDIIFHESIGRTDFPNGDHAALLRAINEHIFPLPDSTIICPGHGPATTVAHEKSHNPFFQ